MAKKNDATPLLPPYLPFKTFESFIMRLNETTVPPRIDSSLLRSYSGSVASQLRGTLRFLGLINEADQTTDGLRELVSASGTPNWQTALGRVVSDAYRELTDGVQLHATTKGELEERFKARGADGDVLRKCLSFYVAAATAGGVSLSPHILAERRGRPVQPRGKSKKSREEPKEPDAESARIPPQAGMIRFSLPLPSNPSATATVSVPEAVTAEDWAMIDATMRTYIHIQKRSKTTE